MSDTLQTELHIDVARKLIDNPEWTPTRLMWSRLLAVAERAQTEAREAATALSEVSRERDEALQERDEARGDLSGAFQQNAYAAVHAIARAEAADAEAASLREELAKARGAAYEDAAKIAGDYCAWGVTWEHNHTVLPQRVAGGIAVRIRARAALNGSGA